MLERVGITTLRQDFLYLPHTCPIELVALTDSNNEYRLIDKEISQHA